MKILHLYAQSNLNIEIPDEVLAQLPKGLGIVSTIQHTHKLDKILEKTQGVLAGQILGCRTEEAEKIAHKVTGFLYIGDGHFHPLAIVINMGKPVWCWNPRTQELSQLKEADFGNFLKQRKAALMRYLTAKTVGIIVSTKSGQNSIRRARELMQRKDKKYYLFAVDTLDYQMLQNFPFIECWVNTACPRIVDEKTEYVNIDQVLAIPAVN